MPTEVSLTIGKHEAKLSIVASGKVLDSEAWAITRPIGAAEAAEFAKALFDNAYDAMNYMVYGNES